MSKLDEVLPSEIVPLSIARSSVPRVGVCECGVWILLESCSIRCEPSVSEASDVVGMDIGVRGALNRSVCSIGQVCCNMVSVVGRKVSKSRNVGRAGESICVSVTELLSGCRS